MAAAQPVQHKQRIDVTAKVRVVQNQSKSGFQVCKEAFACDLLAVEWLLYWCGLREHDQPPESATEGHGIRKSVSMRSDLHALASTTQRGDLVFDINRSVRVDSMCAPALLLALRAGRNQQKKQDKQTPSSVLAKAEQLGVVRALLGARADPNARGQFGVHTLHEAHNPELMHLLIAAKADVNALSLSPGNWSPLLMAFHEHRPECMRVLLNACADVSLAYGQSMYYPGDARACKELLKQHYAELPVILRGELETFLFRPLAAMVVAYLNLPTAEKCQILRHYC